MMRRFSSTARIPREVVATRLIQTLEQHIIDIRSMHKEMDRRMFNNERMVASVSQDIEYIDTQLEKLHARVDVLMVHHRK